MAALLFVAGLAVRLTVRDSIDGLAVLFYATPWPVLALLIIPAAILCAARARIACAVAFVCAGLASLACWFEQSFIRHESDPAPKAIRVVFWNAEHPKRLLPQVIEKLKAADGDILGVVETESTKPADKQRWREAFPGYSFQTLPGAMVFLTRGKVLSNEHGSLNEAGKYNVLKVRMPARDTTVVFVDFNAAPLRSRRPAFERLSELLDCHAGEDIIVMGDFNTPRESVFFTDMRKRMNQAFETAGNGWAETWPLPFPVLSLDHVWTTPSLRVIQCSLHRWLSDHRAVVVDIAQ